MKKRFFIALAAVTVFVSAYLSAKAAPPPSCLSDPYSVCAYYKYNTGPGPFDYIIITQMGIRSAPVL